MSRFLFNDIDCYVKDIPYSNSVTIAYFLDVGLPSENHSQVGISHFLEHMCFRGTDQRTAMKSQSKWMLWVGKLMHIRPKNLLVIL